MLATMSGYPSLFRSPAASQPVGTGELLEFWIGGGFRTLENAPAPLPKCTSNCGSVLNGSRTSPTATSLKPSLLKSAATTNVGDCGRVATIEPDWKVPSPFPKNTST